MTNLPLAMLGTDRWSRSANLLTIARFFGAPLLAGMVLAKNPSWSSFWLAAVLGATDFFDGRLARRAEPTRLGAFLDPLADKLVVLLVGYALVAIGRFGWVPVTIIAFREIVLTVYRSYWARQGLAIPARTSGKYKALIQGLAILAALCPPLGGDGLQWVADGLLWAAVAITVVSGIQYFVDGRSAMSTTGSL